MNANTFVDDENQHYQETKYLGEGVTAWVYQAEQMENETILRDVAIKVMKPNLGERISSNFSSEANTLRRLNHYEQAAQDNIVSVPLLYGKQLKADAPKKFLAMELVDGVPLDEYLDAHSLLNETDALTVTRRMLRLLRLLHNEDNRAYADMQLKNIWLQSKNGSPVTGIKVMDWNTLSNPAIKGDQLAAMKKQDLALYGAYLYRMVTGKNASQKGETIRALEKRADKAWSSLSWGTRYLITKALHPDTARRFQSVEEFEASVAQFDEFRDKETAGLLNLTDDIAIAESFFERMAKGELSETQMDKLNAYELKIEASLDEVEHRADGDVALLNTLRERWRHVKRGDSSVAWAAIKQYFETGQYAAAVKQLDVALRIEGRLEQARWRVAADQATQSRGVFDKVQDEVIQILQLLDADDYEAAGARLRLLSQLPNLTQAFQNEIEIRQTLQSARSKENATEHYDVSRAAELYDKAAKILAVLPQSYATTLQAEEGWYGFEQKATSLKTRAFHLRNKKTLEAELQQSFSRGFNTGTADLETKLQATPDNEILVELALAKVRAHIANDVVGLQEKQALLEVLLLYGNVPNHAATIRQQWENVTSDLRTARQQAERSRMRTEGQSLAKALRTQFQSAQWQAFTQTLEKVRSEYEIDSLDALLIEELDTEFTKAIKDKRAARADLFLQALLKLDTNSRKANSERIASYKQLSAELENLHQNRLSLFEAEIRNELGAETGKYLDRADLERLAAHVGFLLPLISAPTPLNEVDDPAAPPEPHNELRRKLQRFATEAYLRMGDEDIEALTTEKVSKAQTYYSNAQQYTTESDDALAHKHAAWGIATTTVLLKDELPRLQQIETDITAAQKEKVPHERLKSFLAIQGAFKQVKTNVYALWSTLNPPRVPTFPPLTKAENELNALEQTLIAPQKREEASSTPKSKLPWWVPLLLFLAVLGAIAAAIFSGINTLQALDPNNPYLPATVREEVNTPVATQITPQPTPQTADADTVITAISKLSGDIKSNFALLDKSLVDLKSEIVALTEQDPAPPPTDTTDIPPVAINPDLRVAITLPQAPTPPLYDFPETLTFTVGTELAEAIEKTQAGTPIRINQEQAKNLGVMDALAVDSANNEEPNLNVQLQVINPDETTSITEELTFNADANTITVAQASITSGRSLPPSGTYMLRLIVGEGNNMVGLSPDIQIMISPPTPITLPAQPVLLTAPDNTKTSDAAPATGPYVVVGQAIGNVSTGANGLLYFVYIAIRAQENYRDSTIYWIKWDEFAGTIKPEILRDIPVLNADGSR